MPSCGAHRQLYSMTHLGARKNVRIICRDSNRGYLLCSIQSRKFTAVRYFLWSFVILFCGVPRNTGWSLKDSAIKCIWFTYFPVYFNEALSVIQALCRRMVAWLMNDEWEKSVRRSFLSVFQDIVLMSVRLWGDVRYFMTPKLLASLHCQIFGTSCMRLTQEVNVTNFRRKR